MRTPNWGSPVAADVLVINTGPLILLAKASALDVVGRLPFEFVCPKAVRAELDEGAAKGYPEVRPSWLKVCTWRFRCPRWPGPPWTKGRPKSSSSPWNGGIATFAWMTCAGGAWPWPRA